MLAHEIMTGRPLTGMPRTTIRRALGMLRRGHFRHLPILHDGRVCGVLSDRDLQRAVAAGRAEDDAVAGLLRTPAITAAPDTPVEDLARLLQDNKIGCLPIVDVAPGGGDVLVGIVTESDVFGAIARAIGQGEPGCRVAVRLQEPAADVLRVARVLAGLEAPLLSLFTEPLATPSRRLPPALPDALSRPRLRLILRLGTINPRPLEAALAAAGLDVERAGADPDRAPAGTGAAPAKKVPRRRWQDQEPPDEAAPW
jgi:acetoin utilization protein AcuB